MKYSFQFVHPELTRTWHILFNRPCEQKNRIIFVVLFTKLFVAKLCASEWIDFKNFQSWRQRRDSGQPKGDLRLIFQRQKLARTSVQRGWGQWWPPGTNIIKLFCLRWWCNKLKLNLRCYMCLHWRLFVKIQSHLARHLLSIKMKPYNHTYLPTYGRWQKCFTIFVAVSPLQVSRRCHHRYWE